MPPKELEVKTETIKSVPILAVGKWTSMDGLVVNLKKADLMEMVSNFRKLASRVKPFFKLKHLDPKTHVVTVGLTAIGWLENPRVIGTNLIVDIKKVPQKIAAMWRAGAFRRISAEFFPRERPFIDEGDKGKKIINVLSSAGLLGAEHPAVTTLADAFKLFGLQMDESEFVEVEMGTEAEPEEGSTIALCFTVPIQLAFVEETIDLPRKYAVKERFTIDGVENERILSVWDTRAQAEKVVRKRLESGFTTTPTARGGEVEMDEEEIRKLVEKSVKDAVAASTKQLGESHSAELKVVTDALGIDEGGDAVAGIDKLKADNKAQSEAVAKAAASDHDRKVDELVTRFKKEGRLTPAVEPLIREMCAGELDTTTKFIGKDGNEVEGTKLEQVTAYLEALPVTVKFGESGESPDPRKPDDLYTEGDERRVPEDIVRYMAQETELVLDEASLEMNQKVLAFQEAHPGLDYEGALLKVNGGARMAEPGHNLAPVGFEQRTKLTPEAALKLVESLSK